MPGKIEGGRRRGQRRGLPGGAGRWMARGGPAAAPVAPGKLGLDACGKGERVIVLESWEGTRASRRVDITAGSSMTHLPEYWK